MAAYEYQEFPKWKYHPDKEAVVVQNADEEKALGADWFDRPDLAREALAELQAVLSLKKVKHDSA